MRVLMCMRVLMGVVLFDARGSVGITFPAADHRQPLPEHQRALLQVDGNVGHS
jgi:hypothetical protein